MQNTNPYAAMLDYSNERAVIQHFKAIFDLSELFDWEKEYESFITKLKDFGYSGDNIHALRTKAAEWSIWNNRVDHRIPDQGNFMTYICNKHRSG